VVIDDGIEWDVAERVPAGVRLAVHHHNRFARHKIHIFNRHEVEVEQLDHCPVLGSVDQPVASDSRRFPESALDQVRQPQHAAEAVRIGLHVGNESDARRIAQPREELIGWPYA
jgi:hypothetical protein